MKSPYSVVVHFTKKTETLGVEVAQKLPMVDHAHAQAWVKKMGDKIWNVHIIENK